MFTFMSGYEFYALFYWKRHAGCKRDFLVTSIGWLMFYGISTLVGYLVTNPVYTCIYVYIICKQIVLEVTSFLSKLSEPS